MIQGDFLPTILISSVIGFGIGFTFMGSAPEIPENPTYVKDVRPIFEARCSACHNASWPRTNWLDYETAYNSREKIKLRVQAGTMPPTGPLSNWDSEVIYRWVNQGGKL